MDASRTTRTTRNVLPVAACRELLMRTSVGRLAVDVGGRPEIFPINYVVVDGDIVFRSGAGTKLAAAVLMHHVAFEIDGYDPDAHAVWSVIVKGWADEIERMEDVYDAELLPLAPWIDSHKPTFVRIRADEVTGRRFELAEEVTVDASVGWPAPLMEPEP
jgi:hypothetical protein